MRTLTIITTLLLASLVFTSNANETRVGDITITHAWANPLPPVLENGAAFISFSNHAMNDDRLISASSPAAKEIQFHTHVKHGIAMMMKRIESVDVPQMQVLKCNQQAYI